MTLLKVSSAALTTLKATLPGRHDSGTVGFPGISAPPALVGARYVPYGIRSVYAVDVHNL
ncbi:hypothetical protein AB0C98_18775 [Streptomyces sp. NPDC048558]|uniref:hypothetical protein n=1 Tax=Streptomyces sp. NPDC048558 TaxID=3155759 RepID=UPI003440D6EB